MENLQSQYDLILEKVKKAKQELNAFKKDITKKGYYINNNKIKINSEEWGFTYDCTYNLAYVGEYGQMYRSQDGKQIINSIDLFLEIKRKIEELDIKDKKDDVIDESFDITYNSILELINELYKKDLHEELEDVCYDIEIEEFEYDCNDNGELTNLYLYTTTNDDSYSLTEFNVSIEKMKESDEYSKYDSNKVD